MFPTQKTTLSPQYNSSYADSNPAKIAKGDNTTVLRKANHPDMVTTLKVPDPKQTTIAETNEFIAASYPEVHRNLNLNGVGLQVLFKVPMLGGGSQLHVLTSYRQGQGETTAMGGPLDFNKSQQLTVSEALITTASSKLNLLSGFEKDQHKDYLDKINKLIATKGNFDAYYSTHTSTWTNDDGTPGGMNVLTGTIIVDLTKPELDELSKGLEASNIFNIRDFQTVTKVAVTGHQLEDGAKEKKSSLLGGHEVFNDLAITALSKEENSINAY